MSWYLNLLTGTSTDLYVLMGIPILVISALVGIFLVLRDIHDVRMWKKYRNERVPSLRERWLRKHKTTN